MLPVHWIGLPCEMDHICDWAKEKGLIVLEDAAHAYGGGDKCICRRRSATIGVEPAPADVALIASHRSLLFPLAKQCLETNPRLPVRKQEENRWPLTALHGISSDRMNRIGGIFRLREFEAILLILFVLSRNRSAFTGEVQIRKAALRS